MKQQCNGFLLSLTLVSVCGLGAALPATHALAQAAAAPADETSALLAAEDGLFKAQLDHDGAALASRLADEVTYVHANGRVQHKADLVDGANAGKMVYKSITSENRVARVIGDAGITRGESHKLVGDMALTDLYLAVWIKREGRWQLLDWQTSPLAPPKPAGDAPAPAK